MFKVKFNPLKLKLEEHSIYQIGLQTNGVAVGDGVLFEFAMPIYVWNIYNQSAQCYYEHDAILGTRAFTQPTIVLPLSSATLANVNSTYQVNNYGPGASMRLDSLQTISLNQPMRIRKFGLWRITAAVQVHLWFSLSKDII